MAEGKGQMLNRLITALQKGRARMSRPNTQRPTPNTETKESLA